MDPLPVNFELPVEHFGKHREARIVIAGDVNQARARAALREQRSHDVGVIRTPEKPLAQAQGIDDVTHQHNGIRIDSRQKLGQFPNPRAFVSKVDIGQEQSPDSGRSSRGGLHPPRVVNRYVRQMTTGRSIFYATGGCGTILERELRASGRGRALGSQLHAAQRKMTDELATTAQSALDLQLGPMPLEHVFDDSET